MSRADQRLERLLERGFYPAELPPPFKTKNYSGVRASLNPAHDYVGSVTFYDGATHRGSLRTFGVINPNNYFLLSQFIANNWASIANTFRLSKCTGGRPKFPRKGEKGRAIQTSSVAGNRRSQAHLASVYPVVLSLDINRFYGSIYTHSIPWAVLGKQDAKTKWKNKTLDTEWSSKLDQFVRNCNQQQTIGIPIGPDTSRIISEMILSRIDSDLTQPGSSISSSQVWHNIDDYRFGAMDVGQSEEMQSNFVRCINSFELRLNDFKTSLGQGMEFAPESFQIRLDALSDVDGPRLVNGLFSLIYKLSEENPDHNVVGYALKKFAKPLAKSNSKELVVEYLQRLLYASPHQARFIFPLLLGFLGVLKVGPDHRRLIRWGVKTASRRNDTGSLLWFLYAAIYLRIKIESSVCNVCMGLDNPLVDLMLYHGRSEKLFAFDELKMRERYALQDFTTDAWITLYEIERRGWDSDPAFQKIGTSDDRQNLYKFYKGKAVQFYLTKKEIFRVEAFETWPLRTEDFKKEEVLSLKELAESLGYLDVYETNYDL